MWKIISEFRAGYIVMHAPPGFHTRQSKTADIVSEVRGFFSERLNKLRSSGVESAQVLFDPGIGFGKNLEQNLQLIAHLRSLARLRRPLLLGVSRKSFIEKLFGAKVNERLPASLACAILSIESGAHIIRAHDVTETVQAVRMAEAVLNRQKK
jgi:dihydropteroate synthase